jgi:hypothetical protein
VEAMMETKTIDQIPQIPMDCWQVAQELYGEAAISHFSFLAGEAAELMKQAGWTFSHYDWKTGEEIHNPPEVSDGN